MNKTPLTKRGRPKPENFENAVIRLYESGAITSGTFYNLTRANKITNGEAIRVLTDLVLMTRDKQLEAARKLKESLLKE